MLASRDHKADEAHAGRKGVAELEVSVIWIYSKNTSAAITRDRGRKGNRSRRWMERGRSRIIYYEARERRATNGAKPEE